MKKLIYIILSLFISSVASAQILSDTLSSEALNMLLTEQVERLAEESDDETDFEELLESYIFYSENPININSDDIVHLLELRLINVFQYEALKNYRKYYGDFLFIDELEAVEGFDEQTIGIVKAIVYVGKDNSREKVTAQKMLRYGKHQVIGRYEQILERQQGYEPCDDLEVIDHPGQHYLGSPQKYQIRYNYNYRNKIRFGFAAEKGPGEMFFTDNISDTLKTILGDKYRKGFDFYGFHLYANDLGIVKDVAIGDYQLCFGQGLTLWSGMSFGKTTDGSSVMKQARGLRPKTSAAATNFMRGAAITLAHKGIYGTLFYSNRLIDAHISAADSLNEVEMVSSMLETGYHRTLTELQNRHAIREQVFGGHLSYASSHLEIGYTIHHTLLSADLSLQPTHYNQFYFQGHQLTNQGIDVKYIRNKFVLFGEAAMSDNLAFAGLAGVTVRPAGYINFTLSYRNYDKKYQNLFSSSYGESSRNQGEEGLYLGLQAALAPHWNLLAYTDFFRMTWLTSQVYSPSWGHDYYAKLSHQISRNASCYLLLRSKTKMKNTTDGLTFSHYPITYTKNSVRFSINYNIGYNWSLGNKADFEHYYNDDNTDSKGFFICQDIAYKPSGKPYSLTFRYAVFDTDDYYSRIYAYENDVLYSFSVPALYEKGMRVYLLGKAKIGHSLTLYARIGRTIYSDKTEISSGPSLIQGNHKTDLKVEAIWKL